MIKIELTEDEVLVLDGKVRPEVQEIVESAKRRLAARTEIALPPALSDFISEAVEFAVKEGVIKLRWWNLHKCELCGEGGGYWTHKRTTRYHRKGQSNYDAPIMMNGVDLHQGFVVMRGYAKHGCCIKCWNQIKPVLAERLKSQRVQVSEEISGEKPKWIKCDNQKCLKCGWTGHEGQLGRLDTLMGDGKYPGKCPNCGAKNELFSHQIKTVDGFQVVAFAETVEGIEAAKRAAEQAARAAQRPSMP